MQSNFEGKVVLITGAASGFGKLLAQRLAPQGAKLVLGDINETALDALCSELGECAVGLRCDVSIEADQQALAQLAEKSFGRLDIAINNAGISAPMKSLLDTTEADMDLSFAINTKGVFFGMKAQIPLMQQHKCGAILNVASMAGINGAPKLTPYVAAKHAVVGITRTAALEFAAKGIRVNAICPFFTPTPMVTEGVDPALIEQLTRAVPMRRLAEPNEVVSAMLHMVNPDNGFMTGQAIAIDGGVSAI
ncbi:SDR family NAD(P)-dependent oxidoreductase [Shewanella sp. KCT]|uniref:SDR family NAD(P)-dependent oxidoreductase n=1 Tax=Shewanella sp. KCT TaxID=2569535 RepID=UPI00118425B9|nr:glucose 1-dehydrogenase [Shewanella sp. KCT]TVP11888.1 3-oxoacyl-ACP reductase [Shewanella sp. KCT]